MNPIENIRRNVFGISQADMAKIAGTTQTTVSRWESGILFPRHSELARIREAAMARDLAWSDELFFSSPAEQAVQP